MVTNKASSHDAKDRRGARRGARHGGRAEEVVEKSTPAQQGGSALDRTISPPPAVSKHRIRMPIERGNGSAPGKHHGTIINVGRGAVVHVTNEGLDGLLVSKMQAELPQAFYRLRTVVQRERIHSK